MRRSLLVLAVALAAAVPAARAAAPNPLTAALTKTLTAKSERFAMTIGVSANGVTIPLTANGASDNARKLTTMRMDMSKLASAGNLGTPADWKVQAIMDVRSSVMYMRFPLLQKLAHITKPWLELDLRKLGALNGINLGALTQLAGNDPLQQVQLLRAVTGPVRTLGHATIRGAQTTHYRATIDYRKYLTGAPASVKPSVRALLPQMRSPLVPLDVYVDGQGRVARIFLSYGLKTGAGARGSIRADFFGYGAPVSVALPPASQVADVSKLVAQGVRQAQNPKKGG